MAHITEGLGVALNCYIELEGIKERDATVEKHCVLLCNALPYDSATSAAFPNFGGLDLESVLKSLKKVNDNLLSNCCERMYNPLMSFSFINERPVPPAFDFFPEERQPERHFAEEDSNFVQNLRLRRRRPERGSDEELCQGSSSFGTLERLQVSCCCSIHSCGIGHSVLFMPSWSLH